MASYPTSVFHKGSQVVPRNNIALDVAEDGSVRGRKLHTKETYDLTLIHSYQTQTAAETIESFYETSSTQQVDVTWRGDTYNCYWAGKPSLNNEGGALWNVTCRLVGVRSDGG